MARASMIDADDVYELQASGAADSIPAEWQSTWCTRWTWLSAAHTVPRRSARSGLSA